MLIQKLQQIVRVNEENMYVRCCCFSPTPTPTPLLNTYKLRLATKMATLTV